MTKNLGQIKMPFVQWLLFVQCHYIEQWGEQLCMSARIHVIAAALREQFDHAAHLHDH